MKVVVDTNIFVSSFFGGNPKRIIDYWKNGEITVCLSKSIVEEYINVLTRMELGNEQELVELLNLFRKGFNCVFTVQPPSLRIVVKDPDDNKFIECAVATNAKYIVTGDSDLLEIKSYFDIEIINPAMFLIRCQY
ncbi:MAG: putative toxin-antitoxin system toxin component, PIN family [Candidatus Marinimicrobia bacterium]|nr:putative toxin-antitoxin system toxin component, PIN family [Candidatus Neomarinimicrobiota bacterium]MCH7763491.1 putative toxin-antitoxin system toxin component, PIN family [Candidatus Neomarinimicrobiota bacterium]